MLICSYAHQQTCASSMFRHWKLGAAVERVPSVTLDSFFERHSIAKARLIKVDCEGAEALVVQGGTKVLANHRAEFIAMEYHPQICGSEACREAHRQIMKAGYRLTEVSGQHVYHLPSCENSLRPIGELGTTARVRDSDC
jgi:Methyltransferase FkbM domain